MTQEFVTLPREVVEQAMEFSEYHSKYWLGVGTHPQGFVPALRAALEQPQNHVPDAGNMVTAGWKLVPVEPTRDMLTTWIKAPVVSNTTAPDLYRSMLNAAPQPQGEQEPVAFAIFTEAGNARMWSTFQPHVQKLADAEGLTVTPIYTHQQTKRDPLTDERLDAIVFGCGLSCTARDIARAIERAHGITGEAK